LKDIILIILVVLVLAGIILVKNTSPSDVNSLASFDDGKVQVYRVVDELNTCYVTVGYLHGRTVAIHCIQEQECR
jgi:hypothetical protein